MIEPMKLPTKTYPRKKPTRTFTLEPADIETVERFQKRYKLEYFSTTLRRIIRDYAEMMDEKEQAA